MEHRWGERVALDCPARLWLSDGTHLEVRLRNASISGAFIDTETRVPVYTPLSVVLSAGTSPRFRAIELPACVVRNTRAGLAVEWRDMAEPTLVELLREVGGRGAAHCVRQEVA